MSHPNDGADMTALKTSPAPPTHRSAAAISFGAVALSRETCNEPLAR